jgi:hypothetical protein
MKRVVIAGVCVPIVFASIVVATQAAAPWIEARPPLPAEGDEVVVTLQRGAERFGSPGGLTAGGGSWQWLWKYGRRSLEPLSDRGGAAQFVPPVPGVHLVAYADADSGEFGKALLVVGEAAVADPIRFSELGHRLELVPQTDPVVRRDRPGRFEVQLLFEREPLAGATLEARTTDVPVGERRAEKTDEIGIAGLDLDRAGRWVVSAVHADLRASLVVHVGSGR